MVTNDEEITGTFNVRKAQYFPAPIKCFTARINISDLTWFPFAVIAVDTWIVIINNRALMSVSPQTETINYDGIIQPVIQRNISVLVLSVQMACVD